MFTIKTSAEFLDDIKSLDERLKNIRISSIEIDKKSRSVTYEFIYDKTIDDELKNKISAEVSKITSPVFKNVVTKLTKVVSNTDLVNREIFKFINANYPSLSIFLKETDVYSTVFPEIVTYKLRLSPDGNEYVMKNGILSVINEHMARKFCNDFSGSVDIKEAEEIPEILTREVFESQLQKIEARTIKVSDEEVIDDKTIGDVASYIEDVVSGDAVVCGKITEITEKESKNGKPYFLIRIDDTTGRLSGLYFTKKYSVEKIKLLKADDDIIARGKMGEYNGRPSFTFEKINRCVFPTDFVKKPKFKKKAPFEYSTVFPEPASTIKVKSVFDTDSALPDELTSTDYVVFDIETTGLDVMNDSVTEIGAVKIKKGVIAEQFTSLIKPTRVIEDRITQLTGITNEMVKDAPPIEKVLPDFIKFIEGCVIVAHNADFDRGFIRKYAEAEEYVFDNRVMDTMEMTRRYLPELRKADLHTLAEHFGIAFHHHRALADAYATAEAFIELMKIKNK